MSSSAQQPNDTIQVCLVLHSAIMYTIGIFITTLAQYPHLMLVLLCVLVQTIYVILKKLGNKCIQY